MTYEEIDQALRQRGGKCWRGKEGGKRIRHPNVTTSFKLELRMDVNASSEGPLRSEAKSDSGFHKMGRFE